MKKYFKAYKALRLHQWGEQVFLEKITVSALNLMF